MMSIELTVIRIQTEETISLSPDSTFFISKDGELQCIGNSITRIQPIRSQEENKEQYNSHKRGGGY